MIDELTMTTSNICWCQSRTLAECYTDVLYYTCLQTGGVVRMKRLERIYMMQDAKGKRRVRIMSAWATLILVVSALGVFATISYPANAASLKSSDTQQSNATTNAAL